MSRSPVLPEQLDAIRARARAASPGPWMWYGNTNGKSLYLVTWKDPRWPGWSVVMDFVRWGTKSAQPRFIDRTGLMHKAGDDPMPVYQVCPECTDRTDERVYREDVIALRHPDAEFIAASRQDVADLLAHVAWLEAENTRLSDLATELLWKDG